MQTLIQELIRIREGFDTAIQELKGIAVAAPPAPQGEVYTPQNIRGQWTPEARKRHSEAMRKAWQKRRK